MSLLLYLRWSCRLEDQSIDWVAGSIDLIGYCGGGSLVVEVTQWLVIRRVEHILARIVYLPLGEPPLVALGADPLVIGFLILSLISYPTSLPSSPTSQPL